MKILLFALVLLVLWIAGLALNFTLGGFIHLLLLPIAVCGIHIVVTWPSFQSGKDT